MKRILKSFRRIWHGDLTGAAAASERIEFNTSSLISFANNYALIRQGVSEQTLDYKYYYKVHELLTIFSVKDENKQLKRLGRDNDGGYIAVVDKDSLLLSDEKIAYSLGISDDVSFDLELARLGYDIYQYDHTITDTPVHNEKFHWKRIGITGNHETERLKSLDSVIALDGNANKNGMLLKCDIEGAEWDMLRDCDTSLLLKFDQMIIEMHNVTEHKFRKTIIEVLEKISKTHVAVHIHANNNTSANYTSNFITPKTMEVTFVRKDKYKIESANSILPVSLDQPCNNELVDIILGKWNVE